METLIRVARARAGRAPVRRRPRVAGRRPQRDRPRATPADDARCTGAHADRRPARADGLTVADDNPRGGPRMGGQAGPAGRDRLGARRRAGDRLRRRHRRDLQRRAGDGLRRLAGARGAGGQRRRAPEPAHGLLRVLRRPRDDRPADRAGARDRLHRDRAHARLPRQRGALADRRVQAATGSTSRWPAAWAARSPPCCSRSAPRRRSRASSTGRAPSTAPTTSATRRCS